jgi:hypothetical protein
MPGRARAAWKKVWSPTARMPPPSPPSTWPAASLTQRVHMRDQRPLLGQQAAQQLVRQPPRDRGARCSSRSRLSSALSTSRISAATPCATERARASTVWRALSV